MFLSSARRLFGLVGSGSVGGPAVMRWVSAPSRLEETAMPFNAVRVDVGPQDVEVDSGFGERLVSFHYVGSGIPSTFLFATWVGGLRGLQSKAKRRTCFLQPPTTFNPTTFVGFAHHIHHVPFMLHAGRVGGTLAI
jgi:hypothetical protein